MKFAFLVHPLTEETKQMLEWDPAGSLRNSFGNDLLGFCQTLHDSIAHAQRTTEFAAQPRVRVVDELKNMVSIRGAKIDGRLYEIPMDAYEILDDPTRAMEYMEEAVDMAADWGARIVGLGSMTGIVGGQGAYLAERAPVPVTTGNSLTVYAALENLYHACSEVDIDLADETVAVVGIPGSIGAAAAKLLAEKCKSVVLVARRPSARAQRLAEELGAELLLDIPQALQKARVVFTATSSGDCIDQKDLRPGSIVVDVAVPTDVKGIKAERDDVLLLSGGLARVPDSMALDSTYLWFHQGMIPSCMGETTVLALEDRMECFSLGRNLLPERIMEIGKIARSHGYNFTRLFSFGVPLEESALIRFRKATAQRIATARNGEAKAQKSLDWSKIGAPTAEELAPRAKTLHGRHINPVLIALGAKSGFVKTFVKGAGNFLWDDNGERFLDFVAGFGSLNLGHNHPAVVEAVNTALLNGAPGFAQSAVNPYAATLAEQLATLSPAGLEITFFSNSGTEAVEAALKTARCATRRRGLLYCKRSYHGKTMGSLSVTGNPNYQDPFGPLLPDCDSIPYGDLDALKRKLVDEKFAAFIVEPIQAEGGMIVPPADFLREAKALCEKTGTLLITDEVQTGMGRTGKLFAVEHTGVEPDIMTLAKSLGGGLVPIGATISRREVWLKAYGSLHSFASHTSTFGGGSLACAAGLATLKVLREEDLLSNAAARGRQLIEGIRKIGERVPGIEDVRGEGLLIGIQFEPLTDSLRGHLMQMDSGGTNKYLVPGLLDMLSAVPAMYVMQTLLSEHQIYSQVTRSNPHVLRVQPPLTVTAEQVDRFLEALEESFQEISFAAHMADGVLAKSRLGNHGASNRNKTEPSESSAPTLGAAEEK